VPSGSAAAADSDYGSALDHMAETAAGPLVAGGYLRRCRRGASGWRQRAATGCRQAPPPALVPPAEIARGGARAGARRRIRRDAPARELEAAFERAPRSSCT
jgi:hypothetical protein